MDGLGWTQVEQDCVAQEWGAIRDSAPFEPAKSPPLPDYLTPDHRPALSRCSAPRLPSCGHQLNMNNQWPKVMNTFAKRFVLTIAIFAVGVWALADEDRPPPKTGAVQTIKVSGTDLTGLNAIVLTSLLDQAKRQGTTAVIVDMGSVNHMTPAGMESLSAGAQSFGPDHFAVVNLSAQPAELVQSKGAGRFRTFFSVEEAITALRK